MPELQSWMGRELATRFQIDSGRLTASRIDAAIEKALNLSTSNASGLNARWQRLSDDTTAEALLDNKLEANPVAIAKAVHFATIAMLIREAERTGDSRLTQEADAMYGLAPVNVAVRSRQLDIGLPVYRRIQRRALPSDLESLEKSLLHLREGSTNDDKSNAIVFERMARVAPRIRDLTWQEATVLARFMLEADRTAELVAIEINGPQLQHWPNLALAIAERIGSSTEGSIDQALTCSSVMFGINPSLPKSGWRQMLRNEILNRIALGLQHTAESAGHDQRFQWNELRSVLMDQYRLRCTIMDVPGSRISAADSPAALAELLAESIAKSDATTRALTANRFLAKHELQLFALQGQVLSAQFSNEDVPAGTQGTPNSQKQTEADQPTDSLASIILNNEVTILRNLIEAHR